MSKQALKPGATIGILGGGQLGLMLAQEADRLGFKTAVMDSSANCAAGRVASQVIVGDFFDEEKMNQLAAASDVVTLETEHVNYQYLDKLPGALLPISNVFKMIQDRQRQREFLDQNQLPHTDWQSINSESDCDYARYKVGTKAILKSRSGGYDGKGQVRVDRHASLKEAWNELGNVPAVLEAFVPFVMEVSVILARNEEGDIAVFPIAENVHLNHILHLTVAPARIDESVQAKAVALGKDIATAMDFVGTMAVELFVMDNGDLLINEIAPRVHNSGHFTLGACETSQFEQHIRAVAGLPLGSPKALAPSVMLNLLGDLWEGGEPNWEKVHAQAGAKLFLYGKSPARIGRKMGHILVTSDTLELALDIANKLFDELSA